MPSRSSRISSTQNSMQSYNRQANSPTMHWITTMHWIGWGPHRASNRHLHRAAARHRPHASEVIFWGKERGQDPVPAPRREMMPPPYTMAEVSEILDSGVRHGGHPFNHDGHHLDTNFRNQRD